MKKIPLSTHDILHRENLKKIIKTGWFRVAIFWSARIKPNDIQYREIRSLAKQLAEKGYDIITWGGPGAMEAASRGHHMACENCDKISNTIGVNIELPFEQKPNRYLDVAETVSTFSARLDTFMVLSDIFVVTPGGIGTLLELFYTWQLMQVGHICRAPIILWGAEYQPLLTYIQTTLVEKWFLNNDEAELAIQVNSPEEVISLIDTAHKVTEQLGDKACINIKQYIAGARNIGLTS